MKELVEFFAKNREQFKYQRAGTVNMRTVLSDISPEVFPVDTTVEVKLGAHAYEVVHVVGVEGDRWLQFTKVQPAPKPARKKVPEASEEDFDRYGRMIWETVHDGAPWDEAQKTIWINAAKKVLLDRQQTTP